MNAQITYIGIFDMQVCVPKDMTDEEVLKFANINNPCGTSSGWKIRRESEKLLNGDPERISCSKYENNIHIMLDA